MKSLMGVAVVLAVVSAVGSSAWAGDFNINAGNYGQGPTDGTKQYSPDYDKPNFRVLKSGSKVRVVDIKNNIVYGFDYSNPAEQLVQPKLLEHLRAQPGARTVANLIDHITLSDLAVDDQGVLRGNFNIYIVTTSVFGSVSAKLRVGAQMVSKTCTVGRYNGYDPKTGQDLVTKYQGTCIDAELGTSFGLTYLNALNAMGSKPFAPEVINAIGLTADMIFKFYSPAMTGLVSVYEQR